MTLTASVLLVLTANAEMKAEDAAGLVKSLLEGRKHVDLTSVPESDKPAIILELKRYARQERGQGPYAHQATVQLVRLDDSDAIEQQIAVFSSATSLRKARGAADTLALSRSASVIPRVATELAKAEPAAEVYDKVSFEYPKSVLASKIVLGIGENSPELPNNVRQAMRALEPIAVDDRRIILRDWYSENQRFFVDRAYGSISPPRPR